MANQSINISFISTSSFQYVSPIQQVTILDSTNPQFLRQMYVSQDGVLLVRGTSQVKIPKAQLYGAAVAADPTMTWPPLFTTVPANTAVSSPNSASFNVIVNSELPIYYDWQYLSSSLNYWQETSATPSLFTGSHTPALTMSLTNYTDNGYEFRCVATSSAGVTTSSYGILIVL